MKTTRDIKERLLRFGVKPSLQRIAIMDYLLEHRTHPTADTIFNDLYPGIPTLSKTTVYNTLKLFTEQGAILCLNIDEKNARYDGDISSHAHFKCKSCGQLYDLRIDGPDNIRIKDTGDLLITECQIYYKGYCGSCRKAIETKKETTDN